MENIQVSNTTGQNFDTISPSAKALLLLKGLTDIPFVRKAAEFISLPEKYEPDYSSKKFGFWARVVHFEVRYRSIDQLMAGLPEGNIMELSSGFSFRSLQAVQEQQNVHYIDTDLEDIIKTKKELIAELQNGIPGPKGTLELLPLNALDESGFKEIVSHFPKGPVTIVNEGLLVYLDMEEKRKLCKIIHSVLKERGGYWITADIYTKLKDVPQNLEIDDNLTSFLKEHRVEENKFESFEAAKAFFESEGLILDKEAEPAYSKITNIKYLLESVTEEQLANLQKAGKIHATWRLKLAE